MLFVHPAPDPAEDDALIQATRRAGNVIFPLVLSPVREREREDVFPPTAPTHLLEADVHEYLTAMTETIRAHGGTLDKYMGDSILAFFGDADPEGDGDDAEEARVERRAADAVREGAPRRLTCCDPTDLSELLQFGLAAHEPRGGRCRMEPGAARTASASS